MGARSPGRPESSSALVNLQGAVRLRGEATQFLSLLSWGTLFSWIWFSTSSSWGVEYPFVPSCVGLANLDVYAFPEIVPSDWRYRDEVGVSSRGRHRMGDCQMRRLQGKEWCTDLRR